MRNISNLFEGILIDDITATKPDTDITIRTSRNPLHFKSPIAVVKCPCGIIYKKRLFYLNCHDFYIDETLKCPDSSCGNKIELSYRKNY